eukprot:TRINITY_DN1342_c0_g2_i1.p1 TRINITY_DN1342_c0_g2~~TRINITY_DN1342_c0_g2_i1.p1  ORF type:complete len:310 (+),score=37.62 TRINITY_DN1342_c0_g2_i1:114-1043(+)
MDDEIDNLDNAENDQSDSDDKLSEKNSDSSSEDEPIRPSQRVAEQPTELPVILQYENLGNFVRFVVVLPWVEDVAGLRRAVFRALVASSLAQAIGVPPAMDDLELRDNDTGYPLESIVRVRPHDFVIASYLAPPVAENKRAFEAASFTPAKRQAVATPFIGRREARLAPPGSVSQSKPGVMDTKQRVSEHLSFVRTGNPPQSHETASDGGVLTFAACVCLPEFTESYPKIWSALRMARLLRAAWCRLNYDVFHRACSEMNIAVDASNKLPTSVDWEAFVQDTAARGYRFQTLPQSTIADLDRQSIRKKR